MAEPPVEKFFSGAKSLSGSPLGIIALFILLVYGFAALTFGISIGNLGEERLIIVWFLVGFPVLVFLVFALLVVFFHEHLYGPSDFVDQANFLKLQEQLRQERKEKAMLLEVSNVALNVAPAPRMLPLPRTWELPPARVLDDPQKNRWGGQREANGFKISAGKITALKTDSDYFNVPLKVVSTDPKKPLIGVVRFHLHDTFRPAVEEVKVSNGTAKMSLISYGAFTVGAETEDGTKLELDLSDSDIEAPNRFKQS